jgi:hypothetical protein
MVAAAHRAECTSGMRVVSAACSLVLMRIKAARNRAMVGFG